MFKILDEVCTPKRGTKYSAYVDLFAREDVVIGAGETKVVPLGVCVDEEKLRNKAMLYCMATAPKNLHESVFDDYVTNHIEDFISTHYLEVALRSSLAVKGLIIPNGIGIIDLDYQHEIGLIVHNPQKISLSKSKDEMDMWIKHERSDFQIKKGDRVAQCTLKEHKGYLMGYESDVIRDGGFGSTGK